MGQENREVRRTDRARALKAYGTDLRVINEVRNQERDRHAKRGHHHFPMQFDVSRTNQKPASYQQHGRRRIQDRVQGGQVADRQAFSFKSFWMSPASSSIFSLSELS